MNVNRAAFLQGFMEILAQQANIFGFVEYSFSLLRRADRMRF